MQDLVMGTSKSAGSYTDNRKKRKKAPVTWKGGGLEEVRMMLLNQSRMVVVQMLLAVVAGDVRHRKRLGGLAQQGRIAVCLLLEVLLQLG